MKDTVPPAPPTETVMDEGLKRLSEWIKYFEGLSDKIKVLKPNDEDFNLELSSLRKATIKLKDLDEGYGHVLYGWPKPEEVAFVVKIDSSYPNNLTYLKEDDARIFCFGNIAFGPSYFEWDGDGEDDPDCKTYSIRNYSANALSWTYVTKRIKSYLKELTEIVPRFPKNQA